MIGSLIAALATGETVEALNRIKRMVLTYVIAGLLGAVGVGFLIAAAYIRVERELGPLYTALAFGGFFVIVALVVLLTQKVSSRRRAKRFAKRSNADVKKIAIAAAVSAFPLLLRRPSMIGLPIFAAIAAAIYHENGRRSYRRRSRP